MIAKAIQSESSIQSDQPIKSDRIPITHEERFSDAELFSMFNINMDDPLNAAVVTNPMWRVFSRVVNVDAESTEDSRIERSIPQSARAMVFRDSRLSQVNRFPPGSRERIEALRQFYAAGQGRTKSKSVEGKRSSNSFIGGMRKWRTKQQRERGFIGVYDARSRKQKHLVFDEFDQDGLPEAPFEHCDDVVSSWDWDVTA